MFPFDESTEQYFTMVYGVLDVASGEFRYVSAGHPGVAHVPSSGRGRIVENRGFPIGLAELPYEEQVLAMAPGDRLYLYSDGIPEAMDADGKVFGGERMLLALEEARGEPLDQAVASAPAKDTPMERIGGPARRCLARRRRVPGGRRLEGLKKSIHD